jgi:RHS repeat-associated protein
VVTDRLGSVRYSGAGSYSYFPYGEERTVTSDDTEKFGTYLRDGPGQDYAQQRYYNNGTGRFWSVDPGGIKTAVPSNPASLNRYAYVHGDPVNHTDRRGLYRDAQDCIDDPEECEAEDWCDPDGFSLVEGPGCDVGGGPVSVTPPPPKKPKQHTPKCNSWDQNWIDSHGTDAITIEGKLNDTGIQGEADILALSASETTWGASNYAQHGAFFSLESGVPDPNGPDPALFPYSSGWSKPFLNTQGNWMVMAYYSSFLNAGLSFAAKYQVLSGVTNPSSFGTTASQHGYGVNVNTFLSIESDIELCLRNAQSGH